MSQKPSLGRVVLVPIAPARNNGASVAHAHITRVWSDTMVNVRVVPDSQGESTWLTSCRLVDSPDELEVGSARWCWPPRV